MPDPPPQTIEPTDNQGFYRRLRARIRDYAVSNEGKRDAAVDLLLFAPDVVNLLIRLIGDRRVPVKAKFKLAGVLSYFILPTDIIPEALIGVPGYMEDLALGVAAVRQLIRDSGPEIVREHWAGQDDFVELSDALLTRLKDVIGQRWPGRSIPGLNDEPGTSNPAD